MTRDLRSNNDNNTENKWFPASFVVFDNCSVVDACLYKGYDPLCGHNNIPDMKWSVQRRVIIILRCTVINHIVPPRVPDSVQVHDCIQIPSIFIIL